MSIRLLFLCWVKSAASVPNHKILWNCFQGRLSLIKEDQAGGVWEKPVKGLICIIMTGLSLASAVLLACLLSLHLRTATRGSDISKTCCFQYSHKPLPWTWVRSYEFTSNSCSQRAVIFTTKRGKKVCTHPKKKWAQRYISLLKTPKQL
ncbi:C-C motif chemokine 26 isoform X1 [Symphalangus syndactylus]|uniref:C-C motif chemokine 26 isoform X1 n=2 Tax=Symphalangus syndactylus TaxID=9590 RepID=UPI0030048B02